MQFYSKIVLLFIAVVLVCRRVQCRAAGPPVNEGRDRVCNEMLPDHGGAAAQNGNGDYTITTNLPRISDTEYTYTAGQRYTRKCIWWIFNTYSLRSFSSVIIFFGDFTVLVL